MRQDIIYQSVYCCSKRYLVQEGGLQGSSMRLLLWQSFVFALQKVAPLALPPDVTEALHESVMQILNPRPRAQPQSK